MSIINESRFGVDITNLLIPVFSLISKKLSKPYPNEIEEAKTLLEEFKTTPKLTNTLLRLFDQETQEGVGVDQILFPFIMDLNNVNVCYEDKIFPKSAEYKSVNFIKIFLPEKHQSIKSLTNLIIFMKHNNCNFKTSLLFNFKVEKEGAMPVLHATLPTLEFLNGEKCFKLEEVLTSEVEVCFTNMDSNLEIIFADHFTFLPNIETSKTNDYTTVAIELNKELPKEMGGAFTTSNNNLKSSSNKEGSLPSNYNRSFEESLNYDMTALEQWSCEEFKKRNENMKNNYEENISLSSIFLTPSIHKEAAKKDNVVMTLNEFKYKINNYKKEYFNELSKLRKSPLGFSILSHFISMGLKDECIELIKLGYNPNEVDTLNRNSYYWADYYKYENNNEIDSKWLENIYLQFKEKQLNNISLLQTNKAKRMECIKSKRGPENLDPFSRQLYETFVCEDLKSGRNAILSFILHHPVSFLFLRGEYSQLSKEAMK